MDRLEPPNLDAVIAGLAARRACRSRGEVLAEIIGVWRGVDGAWRRRAGHFAAAARARYAFSRSAASSSPGCGSSFTYRVTICRSA